MRSLRSRLIALIALLIVGLAVLLGVYLPVRLDREARRWAESRSLGIARLVANASEAALDFDDEEAARQALARLSSANGVAWAVLAREGGAQLATWGQVPPGAGAGQGSSPVAYADEFLHVSVPVRTRSGAEARLSMGFDLLELAERRRAARGLVLGASALVLSLGLAAAFAIGSLVTSPLLRMAQVARRVARGDLRARGDLELQRRDEVGALAAAFDGMLERLFEQQQELARSNAELEDRLGELRRTQEQLIVADRRTALGRLSAGVAHEINTPLAYISANVSYAEEGVQSLRAALRSPGGLDLERAERRLEGMALALSDAGSGAERAGRIVRNLKAYSHGDEDERVPLPLQRPILAAVEMVGHEVRDRGSLELALGDAPLVLGNELRLTQVFLNLLSNAAHALEGSAGAERRVRISSRTDARGWAVVEVADTGCGIPPEIRGRIFDPFFTTKGVGEGTGLGLSICHGIVAGLGGSIEVESEPGRGATFRVSLPPGKEREPGARPPLPAPERHRSHRAGGPRRRLLVIDDEPRVGAALQRGLEEMEVVAVTGGAEALELLGRGERFDRVLCDIHMPGMDGRAFHARLAVDHPEHEARLIFMTGGTYTDEADAFLASVQDRCLAKPIPLDTLRRRIHESPRD